jgi:hypothetical protein
MAPCGDETVTHPDPERGGGLGMDLPPRLPALLEARVENRLQEGQFGPRAPRDGEGLEEDEHERIGSRLFGTSARRDSRAPLENVCPELETPGASSQHAGPVSVVVKRVPPAARLL